jgi:exonuclease SbcC
MRILAIRGKNLASLEGSFAVELEQPPLDQVGLFAITGPTGAGKSTLLDAICLALFDKIPRLPRGQGIAVGRPDDRERLLSSDVCSVLRRGSHEGYAEVDFIGNDGHRYRARWAARRARQRAGGRLRPQELSLLNLDTQQQLGRTKTEVLEDIAERLGLTFEQFRRSVLLPQGEFAAFLKSDLRQRSELLERITGAEIYSRLSVAAHQRARLEKEALERLEQQLRDCMPSTAARRKALEEQFTEQKRRYQEAEETKQRVQRARDWCLRLAELERLERQAAGDLARAEQALQESAPRWQELQAVQQAQALRGLVAEYDRLVQECALAEQAREQAESATRQAQDRSVRLRQHWQAKEAAMQQVTTELQAARPLLERARILDQQLTEARQQHGKVDGESAEASAQLEQAERLFSQLETERGSVRKQQDRVTDWLTGHVHLGALGRQWERWDGEFRRYLQSAEEAGSVRRQLAQLDHELDELKERSLEVEGRLTASEEGIGLALQRLQTLESAPPLTSLETLRQERTRLEQCRDHLRRLSELAQEAQLKHQEFAELQTGLGDIRRRAEEAGHEAATSAQLLQQQRIALGEAEGALQLALTARKEDVKMLRSRLQDGKPCPVCGATEHPWAYDVRPVAHWIEEQQGRVEMLRSRERELTMTLSRLETVADHARQQTLELTKRAEVLIAQLTGLRQRWAERWQGEALPDDLLAPGLQEQIRCRLNLVETALAGVKESERQSLELQQQITHGRQQLDSARESGETLRKIRDGLLEATHRLSTERTMRQVLLARAGQTHTELREQLANPLAPIADWQEALTADAKAFWKHCEMLALQWRQQQEKSESLARCLQESVPALREAEIELGRAREQVESKAAAAREQQQKLRVLGQQREALFAGQPADLVEAELTRAEKIAGENLAQLSRELESANSDLMAASRDCERCNGELERRRKAREKAHNGLLSALTERHLELPALRHSLQRDASWLEAECAALDALRAQLERAQERLKERRENRKQHQTAEATSQSLEDLEKQLGKAQTDSEAAHMSWVTIASQLRQDDEARAQAEQLQRQCEAQRQHWEVWESLRELIGSADGSKFRTYAQSLTLEALLAHANRHLEDLARRYRLERVPGSDLEL